MYWNDKLQSAEAHELCLVYKITAAKTVQDLLLSPVLTAFDAIAAQATIDSFLGTSSEFNVLAFDATSMGTDAFAGIINMGGQCKEVIQFDALVCGSDGLIDEQKILNASSSLTNSSLTSQVAKGSSGNVAFKVVLTGVDALTAGTIVVKIKWKSK
jgi:hypothetical protein